MQKHKRCESVDKNGHRCNKKRDHAKIEPRKGEDVDPKLRLHSAFGAQW